MSSANLITAQGQPTSTAKVRADPVPKIRAAGAIIATGGHNADMAIRQDMYGFEARGNVGTPPHIRKYRKINNNAPGQIMVHPGLQEGQPSLPKSYAFGRPTQGTDPVDVVIKAQNLNGLADKFNDAKEGKYASSVREPLGKSYQRGYNWPKQAQQSDHAFGVATAYSINAKDVLYPAQGSYEEKPETSKMYQKTHGNFGPGEQRTRDYDWQANPRISEGNVQAHPFGYGEQRLLNGAAKSVMPERIEEAFPKTVIVKKIVEDQKAVSQDMLGTVKNLGQGKHPTDATQAFGVMKRNLDWNAAKCITGELNEQELKPDKDLGRSTKPNCTNAVRKPEDKDRAFGCPTIRVDIPFKQVRSVADYANYGDEPEAVDLLFPSTFTEVGVEESDFQQPRDRETIKNLFESIGYSYKIGKFNAMYNKAKEICNSPNDMVSCRAFMTAVQMLHDQQ